MERDILDPFTKPDMRRDGSGTDLSAPIAVVG